MYRIDDERHSPITFLRKFTVTGLIEPVSCALGVLAVGAVSASCWAVAFFRRRRSVDRKPLPTDAKPAAVVAPPQASQIPNAVPLKPAQRLAFHGLVQISVRTIKPLKLVFRGSKDWKNTIVKATRRLSLGVWGVARAGIRAAIRALVPPQALPALRVVARVDFPAVVVDWLSPYQKGQIRNRDSLPIAPSFA